MPYNRIRSRRKRIAGQAAIIMLAASMLSGCSLVPHKEKQLQPPLVKPAQEKFDSVEVKKGTIERVFKGVATVASSHIVPLFYRDNGRLKDIYVDQGDEVKAGQLIAELDTGDLETRIALQKLNVEKAGIELARAKQTSSNQTDIRLREIDLERERISLESLQQQLDNTRLLAPMDGIVSFKDTLAAGDSVTGYKPLAAIADPNQKYLVYETEDSNAISAVQLNMPVEVKAGDSTVQGKVVQSPSSAPFTDNKELSAQNSKRLYIAVDPGKLKLELGGQADISIVLERRDNVIVLPRNGLRTYLGRSYVQALDGERRKEVDVEPGITTATEVEIVKGLKPGDQIILNN